MSHEPLSTIQRVVTPVIPFFAPYLKRLRVMLTSAMAGVKPQLSPLPPLPRVRYAFVVHTHRPCDTAMEGLIREYPSLTRFL
jgi:hypothetical protein